jgi:hypothetical protein
MSEREMAAKMAAVAGDDIVLQWLPEEGRWQRVPWDQWSKFRLPEIEDVDHVPLMGVRNGDFYFVVCIVEGETLFNIIPHRYRVDADGKITPHNFHDLTSEELADVDRIWLMRSPSEEDESRYEELGRRAYKFLLPPEIAARALLRDLPGFPISAYECPEAGVWHFLNVYGLASPDNRPN